jgi:hypothetical protein
MPNSKRFKSHDLWLTKVSHLRRLISPLGTGDWLFSAPNMPFLAAICGLVNQRQQRITYQQSWT